MMKRILSFLCAAVLACTFACGAAAANSATPSPSPNDYTVRLQDGNLQFLKDQKVGASYAIHTPAQLTLRSDEDGDLLLLFTQPDGRKRNITLRDQKTLSLDGEFQSVSLRSSLLKDISVVLEPTSSIDQLSVYSGGSTYLLGSAKRVSVFGPARLSLGEQAKAGTLRVSHLGARVQAQEGSSVKNAYSVNPSAVDGISSVSEIEEEGSSRSDSSSSSAQDPGPDTLPEKIRIISIIPSMGKILVELSAPVELKASDFYIHCPAGKDMTIISISTPSGSDKNRLYTLNTTYYIDNDYFLQISLPDGRELEQAFTINSLSPELRDFQAKRLSDSSAEITFVSDTAGILYYMAVPQPAARSLIVNSAPKNAAQLRASGDSKKLSSGSNSLTIEGLSEGSAYTFYCAAADTADENLSGLFMPLSIPAKPETAPDTDGYTVVSAEQISDYGFTIVLNKPTKAPLELSAFYAKCPSQAALTLGRVETQDNQTYQVYLKENYFFMPKNHYNVEVTFPDGSKASGRFYAETYPAIGIITAERTPDGTLRVSFNSDKPGTVYCITMTEEEVKPDVSWMTQNAQAKELVAGKNEITFSGIPENHAQFYLVAVDKKGNIPEFVDGTRIVQVSELPEQPEGTNAITGVTVDNSSGRTTTLQLALKEPVDSIGLEPDVTTISGGGDNAPRVFSTWGDNEMFSTTIYIQLNIILEPGEYRVNIHPNGDVLSYTFQVP